MPTPDNLQEQQELAQTDAPPPRESANDDAKLKRALGGVWTRSLDGFGIDPNWLNQIAQNEDRVLTQEGYSPDLKLFDNLLDDDVAMSTFQQRRLDVISKEWVVEPGAQDAQSVAAADHLRDQLKAIAWDDICDKMLYGRWYGYAVAEAVWKIGKDGKLALDTIHVPNRAWFCFSNAGELRLRTHENPEGEAVPDRKFWCIRSGANNDSQHYGVGLAHWVYWPVYFKRNVFQFWALFLEKFGMPTMLGKFPPGWENDSEKLNNLLTALAAVGTDSAVIIPEEAEVEPMEASRSAGGASSYGDFVEVLDTAITRIVLTQTMTSTASGAGLGSKQAEVHEDKGLAVAQSDSDLLCESFNTSIVRWLTEWNFPNATPPRVYRKIESEDDVDTLADRDKKLSELGWERTDESFAEVYGEGYQRKETPEPLAGLPNNPAQIAQKPGQEREDGKKGAGGPLALFAAQFAAHDPQPLYIQRKLLNAGELLDWAKGQGFKNLHPADELHVTVLYCPTPLDWFKLATDAFWTPDKLTIEAGGPRVVEPLGEDGVIVLQFADWELERRHRDLLEGGATHGHATYWPHVTFAEDAAGVDLSTVQPFRGKLEFGPEMWEPIKGTAPIVAPVQFAADQLDAIDRLAFALTQPGSEAIAAMVAPVREALRGLNVTNADPEAVRVAMLQAWEQMDPAQFAAVLADPLVAVRAAEEAGLGADKVV